MEPRRGGRVLLVALVLAAGAAVIGVLLSGPVTASAPLWEPRLPPVTPPPIPSAAPMPTSPGAVPAGARDAAGVLGIVLAVLLAVGVIALVVWLIRRYAAVRVPTEGAEDAEDLDPGADRLPDVAIPAPVMQRGLRRALEILDATGSADDAVVQAWLGLEDAAVEAGAPRRPSETPSEYAARIIRRFDADREAAEELRRLYERVRFGGSAVDAAAVEDARRCLTRLLASWNRAAEAVDR